MTMNSHRRNYAEGRQQNTALRQRGRKYTGKVEMLSRELPHEVNLYEILQRERFKIFMLQIFVSLLPSFSLVPLSSLSLLLSLARFLPTPTLIYTFCIFFLSFKISKNITVYESILLGPRLLYSFLLCLCTHR
jgi:hypothetical protein